tara:strand:+ start:517 stop:1053 length:537 start_codon:yes stop_codon:yes gene_type:complete
MTNNHIFNGIPTVIWESRSAIYGNFGESPPIFTRTGESPKAFVVSKKCSECSLYELSAYEAYISDQNGRIHWECVAKRKTGESEASPLLMSASNVFSPSRSGINLDQETELKLEELLYEIFNLEGFLSKQQATVLSKYKMNKPLRSSSLRNTKQQLKSKLRKMESFVEYWDDLKDLIK